MDKQWIGCASDNFRKGRPAGLKPEMIVLHTLDGSLADADARYSRRGVLMSVHYAVGNNGKINQYVDEKDTAYHAGLVVNPSASLVKSRPNTNPNFYTIGIGLEGKPGQPLTEAQLAASSALIREIADRWSMLLDVDHVVRHSEIRASRPCPGMGVDIQNLLSNAVPNDLAQTITGKEVVSLSSINVRSGASVTAPILHVLAAGAQVNIAGFVVGDAVKGNSFWYQDDKGNFLWAGATDHPDPKALLTDADTDTDTDTMRLPAPAAPAGAGIAINRVRFRLPAGQFYTERRTKDLIVLHFTAGKSAQSAFETWMADPQHVAAVYIIDIQGEIYELFDPAQWAYHLGVKGTNGRHDKRSIAIEIVNVGPLRPDEDTLNWWPEEFKTKFCKKTETQKFIHIPQPYRGIEYFAAFPDEQVKALQDLLNDLCARFNIPKHLPPVSKQYECDLPFFQTYRGIASHANFRIDKWDIGPGFKWSSLGIPNST